MIKREDTQLENGDLEKDNKDNELSSAEQDIISTVGIKLTPDEEISIKDIDILHSDITTLDETSFEIMKNSSQIQSKSSDVIQHELLFGEQLEELKKSLKQNSDLYDTIIPQMITDLSQFTLDAAKIQSKIQICQSNLAMVRNKINICKSNFDILKSKINSGSTS